MVAGHGKLGVFFLYREIDKILLLRKLVAEADTVVINPEPDVHHPAGRWLDKPCKIFVVMVADGADLAPHGTPCLVESRCLRALKLETVHKRRGAFQLQSEAAVVDGLYSFIGDIVDGYAAVDSELQANIAVGRLNRVGCSRQRD